MLAKSAEIASYLFSDIVKYQSVNRTDGKCVVTTTDGIGITFEDKVVSY
jgi:hypothetical protein